MKTDCTTIGRAICLSLLGLSLAACNGGHKKPEAQSEAVPVSLGKVRKIQERESIAASGSIATPNAPAHAGFLVSGKVVSVGPREGDFVGKGQALASIELLDYDLQVAAAKAQTEQTQVGLQRAEDEFRRMKMLYDSRSMASNDFLKFKAAYDAARQQYEQTLASEKLIRKRMADATLIAPISGYIAKRSIEPGAVAAPGQPAFEIVQMDPLEVTVGVPETDVRLVRVGQKATVTVPALPGKVFTGTVRIINVAADPATRTYMTRISVPNPERLLRVGMVAEATIHGDRTIAMTTLPGDAVVRDPQGAPQVFVYYPDQKRVYAKRVEIGAAVNKDVQIKSGLSGNELIVLAGQTRLKNGQLVAATEQAVQK